MIYIDVAVFTKTEKLADVFTYASTQKLSIGQIVKVPFRNRDLFGVVIAINKEKPSFNVREISEALDLSQSLPTHLIKTAFFISDYYLAPLSSVLKTMLPNGFHKKRRELGEKKTEISEPEIKTVTLTSEQKNAIQKIEDFKEKKPFLMHGVTGSGKTEVYLRVIEKVLKEGKQAIVLVPEIALTPQTVIRFEERFPNQVAILHSHLKETERQANWDSLKNGEKTIAIGSRSAIFAPLKNIGIIILDEEHDGSYKQDSTPKYDTREVAKFISKETNSKLILGSATPSVESYQNCLNKSYFLLQLNTRITQSPMPEVRIVDLRQALKNTPNNIFSFELEEELKKVLAEKRKAIIFLNRRGNATFVFCRDCGFVEKCESCDIPLVHHFTEKENLLKCHHCGFAKAIPLKCPSCSSLSIRYYGLGTQRVESEIARLFPTAKTIRMDKDTIKEKGSYEKIFKAFKSDKYNVLLGTQMVSKGWDIPEVDLVGVISADNALNFPDFRANERSFQLLTQISGRPGRRDSRGIVIIQTFKPESPVLDFVKNHDYVGFFKKEIKEREDFDYPPFSKIVRLTFKDKDLKNCQNEANKLKDELDNWFSKNYNGRLGKVLGPSPCFIQKLAEKYRWQLLVKLDLEIEKEELKELFKNIPNNWSIDIDPLNIM